MNVWLKPSFVELCMNAEIGAYQEDTGGEREQPAFIAPDAQKLHAAALPSAPPREGQAADG